MDLPKTNGAMRKLTNSELNDLRTKCVMAESMAGLAYQMASRHDSNWHAGNLASWRNRLTKIDAELAKRVKEVVCHDEDGHDGEGCTCVSDEGDNYYDYFSENDRRL